MRLIGIFTATRWELKAVCRAVLVEEKICVAGSRCVVGRRGDNRLYVFQTGVGAVKAGAACREALTRQPFALAVSSGFACALIPSQIGDLLIGTDVTMQERGAVSSGPGGALSCAEQPRAAAIRAAGEAGLAWHAGRFITVPRVLWRADEKRLVAAATDAVGLDMESAAMGAAAAERRIPFLVVRAASDLLDEDLPLDFNLFLSSTGPIGWVQAAGLCLARPSRLVGLDRLRRQSVVASARLTRFFERFLDDLE